MSGALPIAARPGATALLADALANRFNVLVLEGLDRFSRAWDVKHKRPARMQAFCVLFGCGDRI